VLAEHVDVADDVLVSGLLATNHWKRAAKSGSASSVPRPERLRREERDQADHRADAQRQAPVAVAEAELVVVETVPLSHRPLTFIACAIRAKCSKNFVATSS